MAREAPLRGGTKQSCSPQPLEGDQLSCSLGVEFLMLLTIDILHSAASVSIIKQKAQGESVGQWRVWEEQRRQREHCRGGGMRNAEWERWGWEEDGGAEALGRGSAADPPIWRVDSQEGEGMVRECWGLVVSLYEGF